MNSPISEMLDDVNQHLMLLPFDVQLQIVSRMAILKAVIFDFSVKRVCRLALDFIFATTLLILGFSESIEYGIIALIVSLGFLRSDINTIKQLSVARVISFTIEFVRILRLTKCGDNHIKSILMDLAAKKQGPFAEIISVVIKGMDKYD